ncbi:sugar ABC transporter ATP-binding protein [Candidatus Contubernalis alkaliaceticus]|uniref:sugar ABC transporter ATP-binding protein n=1 Tax=Candidatus Contubernalis alkaliaceticus TaxID=338645 RepID=UPI001F4BED42|nr:sugar ABC transporter ATP-binding protein [Candidatus Contubernalis alkalaceticus]UNC90857.1 sugar ABC transporter ATP-binding protein [Candidatus Contubernalis alkalaceticus]
MVLKLHNVSKKFGNHEVLKSVNFEVKAGEIHGLVGENGAGKSTLLGILFGSANITGTGGYSGRIFISGRQAFIKNSSQAVLQGIGMVHQEFALIPYMTVVENVNMAREKVVPFSRKLMGESLAYIDRRENHRSAEKVFMKLGIKIDTGLKAVDLSVNLRQFVEIAREINKEDLKVLVLDEPTSALTEEETRIFFDVVKELAARGTAVMFVSHRLEEVTYLCENITVMRDGEIVAVYKKNEFNIQKIALDMVGKNIKKARKRKKHRGIGSQVVMELENFFVDMPGENLKGVNLEIFQGEILGLAGLSGHGKLAIGSGIMGLYPFSGRVMMNGIPLNLLDNREVMRKGIFYLPDDRRHAGLLLEHSVLENIIFTSVHLKERFLKSFIFNSLSLLDKKESSKFAVEMVNYLDIRCRSVDQKVKLLSGGNQQKVCLARALSMEPQILFISEPTRGVDVGAKEIILETILNINKETGATIVIASSELGELKRICDRIVVMYEGRVSNIFSPDQDEVQFALAFSGEKVVPG